MAAAHTVCWTSPTNQERVPSDLPTGQSEGVIFSSESSFFAYQSVRTIDCHLSPMKNHQYDNSTTEGKSHTLSTDPTLNFLLVFVRVHTHTCMFRRMICVGQRITGLFLYVGSLELDSDCHVTLGDKFLYAQSPLTSPSVLFHRPRKLSCFN